MFRRVTGGTVSAVSWRRPEFIQARHLWRRQVRRFETSGLQRGALFIFVLSILAVACGSGTEPGTSSADEKARNGDPNADPSSNGADPSHKVTLCHIPPGNPSNAHTISVGAPAVRAHLAHGDYLGPCHGDTDPPGGGSPGPNPSDDGGTPGPGNPDGGGPPGSNPDGGSACQQDGAACGTGLPACCSGICGPAGQCSPHLT